MMVGSAIRVMMVSLLRGVAVMARRHAEARAHSRHALDGDGERHNERDEHAGKAFTHRPFKSTAAELT